jgi:2-methylcitrate dehydratase PrpD
MKRPNSVMAAQYSMPYIVGATLAYGAQRYDAYGPAFHTDNRILDIVDRIDATLDTGLDRFVPEAMPNRVVLHMKDGSEREAQVIESLGSPERPLSLGGVEDKAKALLAMTGGVVDLERIVESVRGFDKIADVADFARLLVIPGYDAEDSGTRAA